MNQWKFGINPFDKKEYRIYSDQHPRIAGVSVSMPDAEATCQLICDAVNLYQSKETQ